MLPEGVSGCARSAFDPQALVVLQPTIVAPPFMIVALVLGELF